MAARGTSTLPPDTRALADTDGAVANVLLHVRSERQHFTMLNFVHLLVASAAAKAQPQLSVDQMAAHPTKNKHKQNRETRDVGERCYANAGGEADLAKAVRCRVQPLRAHWGFGPLKLVTSGAYVPAVAQATASVAAWLRLERTLDGPAPEHRSALLQAAVHLHSSPSSPITTSADKWNCTAALGEMQTRWRDYPLRNFFESREYWALLFVL